MVEDWTGRTIGGYRIAEEIGCGGMAVVYRAHQPQLERWVAIKVLHFSEADEGEFLERFRREAKAIAALRHPNILTIHDYGERHGAAYIVMEYVSGGTLKDRLTGKAVDWPDAAPLVIAVGSALEHAHSQGIIHRDVKPANILLAGSDWPLLADFGLAKLVGAGRGITQPGTSLGTPTYFSPEQAAGEPTDQRTDVYGLGLVAYEMLTGRVPLLSDSSMETLLRRMTQAVIPPRELSPSIPSPLDAALTRALQREPSARYPTMTEFLSDLRRVPGAPGRPVGQPGGRPRRGATTARLAGSGETSGTRLVVAGLGAELPVPLGSEVVIGRTDPALAELPDIDLEAYGGAAVGVSRRHARLLHGDDGWLLEDLSSTNGTYVNGVRLAPNEPTGLHGGDSLQLGSLLLVFHAE
jgi:hypothetical protein